MNILYVEMIVVMFGIILYTIGFMGSRKEAIDLVQRKKLFITAVCMMVVILFCYSRLGSLDKINLLNYIQSHKKELKQVRNKIDHNPQEVISVLEKRLANNPTDDTARGILFKIEGGLGHTTRGIKLYKQMNKKWQRKPEIEALFARLVMDDKELSTTKKKKWFKQLKKQGGDPRLLDYYLGELAYQMGNKKRARHLWQMVLSRLSDESKFYKIVEKKLKLVI